MEVRPSTNTGRALLELEPDLGQLLDDQRRAAAARALLVRVVAIEVGEWNLNGMGEADPRHLGLLVVDGALARHVTIEHTVSTELLGAGDIVRPWSVQEAPGFVAARTHWNALSPVRLALLDARLATQLAPFPEVSAVIVDRLAGRAKRLAITQAISQMTRVDRRLLALFWHLAERWGRVAPDGIAVPLALSHRLIGEFIGAQRPTVSTAMTKLSRNGQLTRRPDGTYLLTGEPLTRSAASTAEVIRQRRRLMPVPGVEPREPEPSAARPGHDALVAALAERRGRSEALLRETAALLEAASAAHARRTQPRSHRRGAPTTA
jgi:CRP/FNR family cyclic AMP-dependent transcriptional regulator